MIVCAKTRVAPSHAAIPPAHVGPKRPNTIAASHPHLRAPRCACGGGCPRCRAQAPPESKFAISQPWEQSERVADSVAEKVMQMPAGGPGVAGVPELSPAPQTNLLQRSPADGAGAVESQPEGQTEAAEPVGPSASDEAADSATSNDAPENLQGGGACCSTENDVQSRAVPSPFNINSDVQTPEMCTNTGCVRVTINSRWASTHAARHFRVTMLVWRSGRLTPTRTAKRFRVGTDTKTFSIGRCKEFSLLIEVLDPPTSPNLVGDVTVVNC